jgi:hypothetical protein
MDSNGQIKTITDTFFSKENISALNKKLLEKNNLLEINKDGKKKIIDLLIKNMKLVYKSLDLKKINKKNFVSIYDQFNKSCFNESQKELSSNDNSTINQLNSSRLKFERDFNSNPNNGNRLSERPVPSQNKNQFLYPPDNNENKNSNPDRFDKLFKPIVEQVNDDYTFNQYQYGKGSNDMNTRMEQLTTERDTETRMNGRPVTPNFLKPIKTQPEKNNENENNNRGPKTIQDIPRKGGKPDFTQDIHRDDLDIGFLSNNSDNGDLYSINNIDKPIDIGEIQEDGRSFQERLKSLENDRSSVSIPLNKEKIDFTSENFGNSQINKELDEIPDYEPKTIEQIREEKYLIEMKKRSELREHNESIHRQQEPMHRQQEPMGRQQEQMRRQQEPMGRQQEPMRRQQEPMGRQQEQMRRQQEPIGRQQEPIGRQQEPMHRQQEQMGRQQEQMGRQQEQMGRQQEPMGRQQEQMQREKQELIRRIQIEKNHNTNQPRENIQKPQVTQRLDKVLSNKNLDIIKIQTTLKKLGMIKNSEVENIIRENEILKNQLAEFNDNKVNSIKEEILLEFKKLNDKEMLISKKMEEMNSLMKKYNYLYGTSNIQFEIESFESQINFPFEFGPIENIVGIKLMSYSIPQARYNIESGKNNIFQIKNINNEIIELNLNSGKYSIDNLIEKLNTKSEKYKFELNVEQIVEISSNELFEIIPTVLSKEILGFTSICKDETKFIADKSWDLRIEEKIYLFINNLDESKPFAVLYTINQGNCNYQFKFEEQIKLDNLELSFKDSKGRPFNFYGLNYSLNIQLEINNLIEEINLT